MSSLLRRDARWFALVVALLAALFAPSAFAQVPDTGVLDQIVKEVTTAIGSWEDKIRSSVQSLFVHLAVIELAIALLVYLAKGRYEGESLFFLVIKNCVVITVFGWLLYNGPEAAGVVIGGLAKIGQIAAETGTLTPSGVMIVGLDTMFLINDQIANASWWQQASGLGLAGFLLSLTVLGLFMWMAGQFVLLLVQAHFMMLVGMLFAAMGVSRFFRQSIQGYISSAISIGVQLMCLHLILGLATALLVKIIPLIIGDTSIDGLLDRLMMAVGIVFLLALLVHKIPAMAASAVTGSVSFSMGDAAAAGAAAGAAAAGAAALATGGAGAVAAAAKGGLQAATAGHDLAKATGEVGMMAIGKGLGHAARAAGQETIASLRSKVGLSPSSPNAVDSRGGEVGNLGTRAANRLQGEAQGARESTAAKQASGTGNGGAEHLGVNHPRYVPPPIEAGDAVNASPAADAPAVEAVAAPQAPTASEATSTAATADAPASEAGTAPQAPVAAEATSTASAANAPAIEAGIEHLGVNHPRYVPPPIEAGDALKGNAAADAPAIKADTTPKGPGAAEASSTAPAAGDPAAKGDTPPLRLDQGSTNAARNEQFTSPKGGGLGDALRRQQMPHLPSDQATGGAGIQINLDTRDE